MSLKCPICGEEYFHDSKICQICENKSIYSGLINNDESKSKKWNCGIFLEFDTVTFGKHKLDDAYIKITSEPKFTDFKPKKEYNWNCDSKVRFKSFYVLKSGVSELRNYMNLPDYDLNFVKKGVNNSILYE